MKKKCVLISGPTIASDQKLGNEIQKYAVVLTNPDNRQLFSILKEEKIELIGNSNLIVKAFQYGVKDAFRKPYKYDLIEERVRVLLNIK